MSPTKLRKKAGKWYLVGLCTLGSIGWIVMLFSDVGSYEPPEDPLAVADVSVHSPFAEQVAHELEQDPIHVDPLLVETLGRSVDTDEVRSAIADSDTPVYILVLPTQGTSTEEDEVVPAMIADASGRDGVFLSFDETGQLREVTHGLDLDGHPLFLPSIYGDSFSEQAVLDVISEVDRQVDQIHERVDEDDSFFASPFVLGLFLGLTFAVPLWYVMKFVRWSARRDRSYLKGFRE